VQTSSNRNGKSTGVMALLAAIVTNNRFGVWSLLPEWTYSRKVWIVANRDNVKENLLDIFDYYIKGTAYDANKDGRHYNAHYHFPATGFDLYVKTYGQADDSFEFTTVGVVVYDEPPKASIWEAVKSRLIQGGLLLMGATPLFGAGYLYDDVLLVAGRPDTLYWHQEAPIYHNIVDDGYWYKTNGNKLRFLRPDQMGEYARVSATGVDCGSLPGVWTEDELRAYGYDDDVVQIIAGEHKGKLPIYEISQAIRDFEKDDETYDARVYGHFKFLSGAVYKTWINHRDNIFINIPPANDQTQYMHRLIIDPHDRRPPVAAWERIDEWHRRYIIREWPSQADDCYGHRPYEQIDSAEPYVIADYVRMWLDIETEYKIKNTERNPVVVVMDPNFGRKPNAVTGKMVWEEYADEFRRQGSPRPIRTDAIDDLMAGHDKVREMLKPTPDGDYMMYVDRGCLNIDNYMRKYKYKEWSGHTADTRAQAEGVEEKFKDFCDLIRYTAMTPIYFDKRIAPAWTDPYHRAFLQAEASGKPLSPVAVQSDLADRVNRLRSMTRPKNV
jgi:hypothetical protein